MLISRKRPIRLMIDPMELITRMHLVRIVSLMMPDKNLISMIISDQVDLMILSRINLIQLLKMIHLLQNQALTIHLEINRALFPHKQM